MTNNNSQIRYEDVEQVASGFQDAHQILSTINVTLEAAVTVLRTTAFIGLVGGMAFERYIANIQPKVERLANKCEEMSGDLRQVIAQRKSADQESTTSFT